MRSSPFRLIWWALITALVCGTSVLWSPSPIRTASALSVTPYVSTLAGNQTWVRDGLRTSARFLSPTEVTLGIFGGKKYLFYAGERENFVRRIALDSPPNMVETIAGTGVTGWQDGPGAQAKFSSPFGTAWNPNRNVLYVADQINQRIRVVNVSSPTYEVSTLAGTGEMGFENGSPGTASFSYPYNLAFDSTRNLIYVSDNVNHQIRTVNADTGYVSVLCGIVRSAGFVDGTCSSAKMFWPLDLALDGTNSALYFIDIGNSVIRRIDLATNTVSKIAGVVGSPGYQDGAGTIAQFRSPWGITVNSAGTLIYVADTENYRIRLIDRTSTPQVSTLSGFDFDIADGHCSVARFARPMGMTIDLTDDNYIYFAEISSYRIRKFDVPSCQVSTLNGDGFTYLDVIQPSSLATPQFSNPRGIAVDPSLGAIFVADMNNHAIRVIDPNDQIVVTLTGGNGSAGFNNGLFSAALFNSPTGIAVNSDASIAYVADRSNHCVRKLNRTSNEVSTLAGTCGDIYSDLYYPFSVTVEPGGNSLLIADSGDHQIHRVDLTSGVLTLVAGVYYSAGYVDGPALSAKFNSPFHVCVDSLSDIYVTDYSNHRIRKISAGTVSTVAGSTAGYVDGATIISQFNYPSSIICDESSGQLRLWIADSGNNVIRVLSATGVTTVAGGIRTGLNGGMPGFANGVHSEAIFRTPISISMDPVSQILYISDAENMRVRTLGRPYLRPTPSSMLASNDITITIQGRGFCGADCSLNTVSLSQWAGTLYCAQIITCSYSNIVCKLGGEGISGTVQASVSVSQYSCPVVGDSNLEAVADAMPMHSISTRNTPLAQNAALLHIYGQKFLNLDLPYYGVYLSSGACSVSDVIDGNTIVCGFTNQPEVGPLHATVQIGSGNCTFEQVAMIVPQPSILGSTSNIAVNAISIVINGSNFATLPEDNEIHLTQNGVSPDPQCEIVEGASDYLVCSNLTGLSTGGTGELSAVVTSHGGNSSPVQIASVVPAPSITQHTEDVFLSVDTVFIHGSGFSPVPSENQVALFQPGQTETLSCSVNESTAVSITCDLDQFLIIGPLSAIVYVYSGHSDEVQIATVIPDPISISSTISSPTSSSTSGTHSSVGSEATSGTHSSVASPSTSAAKSSASINSVTSTSSGEDNPGNAGVVPFIIGTIGFLLLILLILIVIIVVVIVIIVILLIVFKNNPRQSDEYAVELVDNTTVPTTSLAPTADLLWEFEEEEEEEKEGRMQQKELSHISKRVKLSTDERAKADEIARTYSSNKTLPYIDIRNDNMISFISIALVLLENVDTRPCGSELTCFIWGSFLTDQQRLDALRKYKLLFSLLQACVHLSDPSDWSFVERLQRTMQSYNQQLAESRYTLHDEIGSGAFGSVYIAQRQGASQSERVAIKVIKFAKKGYDEHSTEQLISLRKIKREIVIMSILAMDNNPWLIYFMGHQLEPMKVSIIMAMAKGNVKDVLAANRRLRKTNANSSASGSESSSSSSAVLLPFSSRLDIAIQVASALHYLHSFSIVHRDLKSENILVMNRITMENPRASVRLIDFGISRTTSEAESTFVTGTISWMAPEILDTGESDKKIELTTQCDVYSFGYLLWTLLTEREPHSSYAHSIESVKRAVIANSDCPLPIPPVQQIPDFSSSSTASSASASFSQPMYDQFCKLLMSCWRTVPHKRPTMSVVLEELRKIQAMLAN